MRDLQRKVGQISRTRIPVLIEGETGTGKETLARYIHAATPDAGAFTRFVCSNGDALGLERSADTDGWVFFKYVDRLDPSAQSQLQAVIDRQWGGGNWQGVISSASQPLHSLAAQNRFNAALYHHLAGVRLRVPPLRERQPDILELFEAFVREYAGNTDPAIPMLSQELRDMLAAYPWPGNVLELSNLAAIFAVSANNSEIVEELQRRFDSIRPAVQERLPLKEQVRKASRELESGIILRTLENHRWNRRRTAESLNISYRSLLYKMKACNLRGETVGGEGL
jgi:DNA-binding NtrC family response regulator